MLESPVPLLAGFLGNYAKKLNLVVVNLDEEVGKIKIHCPPDLI